MGNTLNFSFKVWLTSIFIGPLFLLLNASNNHAVMFNTDIAQIINYVFSSDFVVYYLLAVVIGGACSMPCFLLLWLCCAFLKKMSFSVWAVKGLLIVFSVCCTAGIFMLFSMSDLGTFWNKGNMIMIGSYAIPLTAGLLFYPLNKKAGRLQEAVEEVPDTGK